MQGSESPAGHAAAAATSRLVVLLSGGGRTLENLAESIRERALPATIAGVVSSHLDAFGLERARRLQIPATTVDYRAARGEAFSAAVTEAVDALAPDVVVMAGFIRRWCFPDRYAGRVLNVHPALLPAFGGKGFYGDHVHRAVLAAGVRFSGCTVHFADHAYDRGPIILQRVVPVHDDDTPQTLAARVFAEECIAYPEAIRLLVEGRLEIREGRVTIRPAKCRGS